MIGRYLIIARDEYGKLVRAFTWHGALADGFQRAREESAQRGYFRLTLTADPIANR